MISKSLILVSCLFLSATNGFEDKTIAQWLTDNGYTTLVSFLKTAGLYDTLNKPGAYTLFAPNEAAFNKLPASTVTSLTTNTQMLRDVLNYHLVSGFTMVPSLQDGSMKQSVFGQNITFHKYANGTLTADNAAITTSDIILNNGVVHVVDGVLMPVTDKIAEILLKRNDEFSTLNMLLTITDLAPALLSGQLTLFAPTNAAFQNITQRLPDFSAPNAIQTYKEILLNHVVNTTLLSSALQNGQTITALNRKQLRVNTGAGGVTIAAVNGRQTPAKVTEADVKASNGVIHVIDQVLLPENVRRRRSNVRFV